MRVYTIEDLKTILKKAVEKALRENSCNKCPDIYSGELRLKVRPDCECVGFKNGRDELVKNIEKILKYYEEE